MEEFEEGMSTAYILELIAQRDFYIRNLQKECEYLRCKIDNLNKR